MKFPLTRRPFAPLQPTAAELAELDRIANHMPQETVDEYEQFVHVQNRKVDTSMWKHAKTRENMSVYKATNRHSTYPAQPRQRDLTYTATQLTGGIPMIAVGSIVGNLADLMYTATAFNDGDMKIRTSYILDEVVDWQLLCTLKEGTTEDPFRRHSIKWMVKEAPGLASTIVRYRDMVFLDCIGQLQLPSGERVGYVIYRTIDIPECPEIKGIVRADVSACYLLRPQGPNSMEVYMRSQIDAKGNSPDAVTAVSAANALIAIWRMSWGGQNKKLGWMLEQASSQETQLCWERVQRVTAQCV
ncbi:hypothetical protein Poli38472_002016 [Pythium oligandrum]|uniref:START domain-containing protein n=1 Tax=Pythium oligandrum TaxID=41045 RepID=A0A8K1CW97_PYTOL|nr:hypothetical protein Poli38472_002016 [Pythium oligandrum]|eukprot:TMW69860.1 hypothetical protein Poli38472_002016 [Pythium oligandrum]